MWYIYQWNYYSAVLLKNEIIKFSGKWMEFEKNYSE